MPGRLVLLATTGRVAAGLVTLGAWSLLRSADLVVVSGRDHPLLPSLAEAAIGVRVIEPVGDPDSARPLVERWMSEVAGGVVWVLAPGQDAASFSSLPCESLIASWDLPGAHLLDLVAVMDRLRSPGGCPWDAKQTHVSLVEYLVEEAYEMAEAIETDDDEALREELGDVLLQVAFHSRIAQEHVDPWTIDDVADGVVAKLISRHPHVFGDSSADSAEQVEADWASLKAAEKGRASVTDGIPQALPALVLAAKLLSRANRVEVEPVSSSTAAGVADALSAAQGSYGDLLLAIVAQARADGVDAEQSLRQSLREYRARVRAAEGLTG
ncbi:unannotated protein [freshwater metagenome]|uniref:Unannotated protein n=1 Tax=freshwater metagenome TaxID=449393 RepID=A0A6J7I1C7_9ZZZZ|nr:MazG family protein [Actinomycetota bacterium]